MGIVTKRVNEFPTPYTCRNAIQKGGPETKLSMILMGLGNFVHGQKIKGLLYLAVEVAYIVFMAVNGITFLSMLGGLGSVPQKEVWDEASQVYLYTKGDQSILILLYGVATILVSVLMVFAWRGALQSAYKAECLAKEGKHVNTFGEDLKSLLHENLHRLLMTPPMIFIFGFTILPLIFMICMAFTNYSKIDNHLMLFDWVGLDNFKALFDSSSILGSTFWSVLVWTLVWAFFATFTNYFFRNDPCNHDQPERYKGKGILEILFCTFLCSADVCISFDHAYHAAAGRCGQCTVKKLRVDRAGCKSPVFHRSDLGESDCDRGQYLGRCSVYTASADRCSSEYPGRSL